MTDDQTVLVVNAGSSSLKYQLVLPGSGAVLASGLVERIGEAAGAVSHRVGAARHDLEGAVPDHRRAFELVIGAFAEHGPDLAATPLAAVGHRIVHGGERFREPALIDDEVIEAVESLIPLAPLHNPGNLEGVRVAREVFPGVPQVAVFDTAFHATLPEPAYTYALPLSWRDEHRIRRYGFHGTSHAFVSRRAAELLGRPLNEVNTIVLHLGNGASACAVRGGVSVDTSMGLTPLEGLVMGTRPGDLDPGILPHLVRTLGMSMTEIDTALSKASGLKGLTGDNDFRAVSQRAAAGDRAAELAIDVVAHRLKKYLGGYAAVLERLDAVVFTGGIGEHSPMLRARVLTGLGVLGVDLDVAANEAGTTVITSASSRVAAFVIPTNEELQIAREALALVG